MTRPAALFAALALAAVLGACAEEAPPAPLPPPGPAFAPPPGPPGPPPRPYPPLAYAPPPVVAAAEPRLPPGLLPAPPANAGPGECYAQIRVRGVVTARPPAQPRATWVLTPPPPGGDTPLWCLYFEPGAPQPPIVGPDRTGWIRVICDERRTREEIRHVQRRLRAWGVYDGEESGRYDAPTASAVRRFQSWRRIDHGGYLSTDTLDALEAPPESPTGVAAAYPPPAPPPPIMIPPPPGATLGAPILACGPQRACGPAACAPVGCGYGPRRDEGRPPYLAWPGKTIY